MKTKGINTQAQIDSFKRTNRLTDEAEKELSLKEMINSCFTYGGADKDNYNFERYISPYKQQLGEELFNEVYEEQLAFLKANCEVKHGVHTDYEGCTYNSLVVKES